MRKVWLYSLGIGVSGCLAALGYAAFVHRPMFSDGGYWYYNILQNHRVFYDESRDRFFGTVVFQLPVLALMRLFPAHAGAIGIRALDVVYSLHPIFSLFLCALILWRHRRLDLIVFPIFSFVWATEPTVAFHVGTVPDTASVFWPLFLLLLLKRPSSVAAVCCILVLTVGLVFTYEAGILLVALLFVVNVWRARTDRRDATICGSGLALGGLFLVYRLVGPTSVATTQFFGSLRGLEATPPAYTVYACWMASLLLVFTAASCFGGQRRRGIFSISLLTGFLVVLAAFIRILSSPDLFYKVSIWGAFDSRVLTIPLIFVVALSALFYERIRDEKGRPVAILAVIGSVALVTAAIFDFNLSRQFKRGMDQFQAYVSYHQGCVKIDREEWDRNWAAKAMTDWTAPFVSAVLQADGKVQTVIFTERQKGSFEKLDPCISRTGALGNPVLKYDYDFEFPLQNTGIFDYSELIRSPTIRSPRIPSSR